MHDLVHLERRGIPAVGIATTPFADEAIEQARRLGMPGARMVYIPHPVQLLTDDELDARADAVFPDVLAALTGGDPDRSPGGTATARTGAPARGNQRGSRTSHARRVGDTGAGALAGYVR